MNFPIIALAASVSVLRVLALIGVSILTGWLLAYPAAKNRGFESAYVTALGVLESVPVIGFFPLVLVFFLYRIGGSLGTELAADFLVFDAVVWNIWVGTYQAFKTIPKEWVEVGENYGYSTFKKIWKVYVPFSVPRIAANLFPSFADGLFYLTVSEVVTIGLHTYETFGAGSLITNYLSEGQLSSVYYTLLFLAVAVVTATLALRLFANWAVAKFTVDTDIPITRRGRIRARYSITTARTLSMNTMARLSSYARRLTPRSVRTQGETRLPQRLRSFIHSLPKHSRLIVAVVGFSLLAYIGYSAWILVSGVGYATWFYLISNTPNFLYGLLVDYIRVAVITGASFVLATTLGYMLAVKKGVE
ncbi:MAG: ABC transporter permease subunit, partial [Thermoprotei archaeon]